MFIGTYYPVVPAAYYIDALGSAYVVDQQGYVVDLADSATFTAFPLSVRAEGTKPAMVVAAIGALAIAGLATYAAVKGGKKLWKARS
jgi:hypothetical protein